MTLSWSVIFSALILVACSEGEADGSRVTATMQSDDDVTLAPTATNVNYDPPYLVFEFPDGVRGGFGKFVGEKYGTSEVAGDGCGLVDPVNVNSWSHSSHLVTKSTSRDSDIVECMLRNSNSHFNVYHTDDASLVGLRRAEMPFQDLMNNPTAQRPNREK